MQIVRAGRVVAEIGRLVSLGDMEAFVATILERLEDMHPSKGEFRAATPGL